MPCYHPLTGYRSNTVNPSGKRSIVFNPTQGQSDDPLELPCGQCIGCRLERSRQWAIRCVHEASLHPRNCFVTLTYNNQNLPKDNTLVLEDWQKFMKRLRKKFGNKIRFFHCGEYGERFQRPHYHACLFGLDFRDKKYWKSNENGDRMYTSETLEQIWGKGFCTIGDVTFESAAYVARYITKKITGDQAIHHYCEIDYSTGELLAERKPEYVTMSRRPGIGANWFKKYKSDVYPKDFVVLNGKKLKPPKYYDTQFEITDPYDLDDIKFKREIRANKHKKNNTPERLAVRKEIQEYKFKQLKRSYEK